MLTRSDVAHVLFFDMREMDRLANVRRVVNEMAKHPANPVIRPGPSGAWDSVRAKCYGTVLYDRGVRRFRMWYSGAGPWPPYTRHIGYAESEDGIAWEKPVLGIVEHPLCGRNHNVVILNGQFPAVVEHSSGPHRFSCMWSPGGPTLGRYLAWSDDGIHWTPQSDDFVIPPKDARGQFVEPTSLLYDPGDPNPDRRWKTYGQVWIRSPLKSNPLNTSPIRMVGLHTSPDLIHWTEWPEPVLDPKDGREDQIHMGIVTKYHGHYVMLYDFMYPNSSCDEELATSRDGIRFARVNNGEKVLPLGERGAWDSSLICSSNQFFEHEGKLWFYYVGSPENFAEGPWPPNSHEFRWFRFTGIAQHRLDGFTSLDLAPGRTTGEAITHPIDLEGKPGRLWLNAAVPVGSRLRVEVIGAATDAPLTGYDRAGCSGLTGDSVRHVVRWRRGDVVRAHRPVRLRFVWEGPVKLYSFGCTEPDTPAV